MPIAPAFSFFPSDYLGDPHTIVMTTEENGAYCLLMWVCWEQDGLPNDIEELAGYARLTLKKFQPMWERRLKRCFDFDEKRNQFVHPRFEKIIREIKAFRKKKSNAGKVSGQRRRERKELDAEQVLDSVSTEAEQETNKIEPSSSIPSSSSSSEKKSKKKAPPTSRPELIALWKSDPYYVGIDVDKEVEKMDRWLSRNPNRKFTKNFAEKWLDGADRTILPTNGNGNGQPVKQNWQLAIEACATCDEKGIVWIEGEPTVCNHK